MFDAKAVRADFPIFSGDLSDLAFLDSAASSQKPSLVIDRITKYYSSEHANVHRGVYALSENATRYFEEARKKVANFINASDSCEVIFTKGTTESVNIVALSWGKQNLKPGDEILLTVSEHHSNIVPWQMVAEQTGAKVVFLPINPEYRIDAETAKGFFSAKTKILSIAHVSNVFGVKHPIEKLIKLAKACGAMVFIDGAQGIVHHDVDVQSLGADFYGFSGHKMLGPTGVGILWGKKQMLEDLQPLFGGGDMIERVTQEGSTWAGLPNKLEAGTPNISGAIGLGAAVDYLDSLDRQSARIWEKHLGSLVIRELSKNSSIKLFVRDGDDWCGIVTFLHKTIHPHDLASILGNEKVCIRAGHHCAQPLMNAIGATATCRVSPFIYNTENDIEQFFRAIHKAQSLFG
jgi:cysteine desulfurase/selenocysteine lyase